MSHIVSAETVRSAAIELTAQSAADPGVAADLHAINERRWGASEDVRKLRGLTPFLPELPEAAAGEVYERVCEQERRVAPNLLEHEYKLGAAAYDDHIAEFGNGPLILEAQHATDPRRKEPDSRGNADHGTAGLVGVMALEGFGRAIIPLGRQTSNATGTDWHPIRDNVATNVATGAYSGFVSFHGMRPNKVTDLRDPTEIHAIIGLGNEPRDSVIEAAERLAQEAHDSLGLQVVIGNFMPHVKYAKNPDWDGVSYRDLSNNLDENNQGQPAIGRMASTGLKHMVAYVNGITTVQPNFKVAQLELARSIRKTPNDLWVRPDPSAEKMGVYLGYLFCTLAARTLSAKGAGE